MHGSYFETGHEVENLLFKGLTVSSIGGFVGLCIGAFILTFLHEGLRVFRKHVDFGALGLPPGARPPSPPSSPKKHEESPITPSSDSPGRSERAYLVRVGALSTRHISRTKFQLLQSSLYVLQVFMAYVVMLVVMSYNVWLFLSVLLGAGAAHFALGLTSLNANCLIPTPDSAHCETGH